MSHMNELNAKHIKTIKDSSRRLSGHNRRLFQAQVALDYLDEGSRKAEQIFGWSRKTVELGLNELKSGIECIGYFSARGNQNTEKKNPKLEADIRSLAEPESQVDPKFQSPFVFTRMTAKAMRKALIDVKNWSSKDLPTENTIGHIMNRLGYKLRRVQKAKPLKKIKETNAIFNQIKTINQEADEALDTIRISIDTKAKVDIGEYSRGGLTRSKTATKALDHDMNVKKK